MSQPQDRSPEPTGLRFQRRMSQLQRDREAEAEAEKEAKVKALQQELMVEFEKERTHSRSKSLTNGPDDLGNRFRQAKVEDQDEGEQLLNDHSNGAPLQSSTAMVTPPPTPHSPNTGNVHELEAHYPRNTIQTLTSRLEQEERRVTELEQELGRARAQLEHYIADQNSVHRLQIQAVVANDRAEIARLREQVTELKALAESSMDEVSRLQEERRQKDRLIDRLRAEIREKSRELQETAVPVRAQEDGRRSEQQVRHGCSRMRLERNSNGIRIRRNTSVLPMANSVAFPLT